MMRSVNCITNLCWLWLSLSILSGVASWGALPQGHVLGGSDAQVLPTCLCRATWPWPCCWLACHMKSYIRSKAMEIHMIHAAATYYQLSFLFMQHAFTTCIRIHDPVAPWSWPGNNYDAGTVVVADIPNLYPCSNCCVTHVYLRTIETSRHSRCCGNTTS